MASTTVEETPTTVDLAVPATVTPALPTGTVSITEDGDRQWRLDGVLHRVDGPAVETAGGDKEWWVEGVRHRVDGPAVVRSNGDREWFLDGLRHREDGPAIEHVSGRLEWWVDGHPVHFPELRLSQAVDQFRSERARQMACSCGAARRQVGRARTFAGRH